jgi:type II secretory pathway pseudopilin PulG
VIAIIAILAAILFPVFSQAREKARQAACTSNEKNIALALQQYAQDYDEIFVYSPTWCNIPAQ